MSVPDLVLLLRVLGLLARDQGMAVSLICPLHKLCSLLHTRAHAAHPNLRYCLCFLLTLTPHHDHVLLLFFLLFFFFLQPSEPWLAPIEEVDPARTVSTEICPFSQRQSLFYDLLLELLTGILVTPRPRRYLNCGPHTAPSCSWPGYRASL